MDELYALLNSGQWKKAGKRAKALLDKSPRNAEAMQAMGLASLAMGAAAEACNWFRRAIQQQPAVAAYHYYLGLALQATGETAAAIAAYEAALERDASLFAAHLNLGEMLYASGRLEAAAAAFNRALQLQPGFAVAHFNLANIQRELGLTEQAATSYLQAIRFDPADADAQANLGALYQEQGKNDLALPHLRAAIRLQPGHAPAHINLGKLLAETDQPDAAEKSFHEGLRLNANDPVGWFRLCDLLFKKRDYKGAAHAARQGLKLRPDDKAGWTALYEISHKKGDFEDAEQAARECLRLDPDDCMGWIRLSNALEKKLDYAGAEDAARKALESPACHREALWCLMAVRNAQNQFAEADAFIDQLVAMDPKDLVPYQTWLFSSNQRNDIAPMQAKATALKFAEVARENAQPYATWNCERVTERKLRIGLVSGDFQRHPVGYLLLKPLHEIDRGHFELFFYSNDDYQDDLTARFKHQATQWRDVAKMDDARLAAQIHEDAIDILIDLAGVTAKNRLTVFPWRPAPVQVTWLGYFATTGLSEIDWILADNRVLPPAEEAHFVEKPWRLPDSYYCYTPPTDTLPVAPLPALARGNFTFGCFNGYHKLNDRVLRLWAEIMQKATDSRLYLKNKALGNDGIRAGVEDKFARRGIDKARLRLEGISSHGQYMRAYNEVDIALDPFPFPGGITTIEGLWMGVPVITLKGERYIGHQGETILQSAGLPDWIAQDEDDYVSKVLQHMADLSALVNLRENLREQVRHSALCDATRFARNLEEAWRGMWRKWCEHQKS